MDSCRFESGAPARFTTVEQAELPRTLNPLPQSLNFQTDFHSGLEFVKPGCIQQWKVTVSSSAHSDIWIFVDWSIKLWMTVENSDICTRENRQEFPFVEAPV